MIELEEVRTALTTAFKEVHSVHYPAMLVNYPNFAVVDIEHQKLPFVSLEIDFNNTPRSALGEKEILVNGVFRVLYFHRDGKGMEGSYIYADMLNSALGMNLIGSIQYEAVDTMTIDIIPGWATEMHAIGFDVVKPLNC